MMKYSSLGQKELDSGAVLFGKAPHAGRPDTIFLLLRKAQKDGFEIRDASAQLRNFDADPARLRPDRKVGQGFLGAE